MNNSRLVIEQATLAEDEGFNRIPWLQEKRASLTRSIEALQKVANLRDWTVLRDEMFDGVVESLERELRTESLKKDLDNSKIHSLQGQLVWARKYTDLKSLADGLKVELKRIKKLLHGRETDYGESNGS